MQINKKWLDKLLNELDVDNCALDKVTAFKNQLEILLTCRLLLSEWTLIEFFILSIGIRIADELLCSHLYQFAINAHECHLRSLNQNDVRRIIQKYYQYYYEKLNFLTQLSKSKGMVGFYSAIEWLELVISVKADLYIPQEVILHSITNEITYDLEVEIKSSGMIELTSPSMAKA